MKQYLQASKIINWRTPEVKTKAESLSQNCSSKNDVIQTCFEFVRDEIKHSWDYQLLPMTCKASDVLLHKTGFCFAKSHLLAALLRANNIPTALCYQRLKVSDNPNQYSLHGLNAVYLDDIGWHRIDPRGNKEGVNADFCPPQEKLAFSLTDSGELNLAERFVDPLDIVVNFLESKPASLDELPALPDLSLSEFKQTSLNVNE